MRITKVSVKGLFGMFDHEIPLNQESRITIIHGPNGVGKTVLMEMVHGLFHFDYEYIAGIPFDQLCITLIEGTKVSLERQLENQIDDHDSTLTISCTAETGEEFTSFVPSATDDSALNERIMELDPNLIHVVMLWRKNYWLALGSVKDLDIDDSDHLKLLTNIAVRSEVFTRAEMLRKYPALLTEAYGKKPDWLMRVQSDTIPQLISTARLRHEFEKSELVWTWMINQMPALRGAQETSSEFYFPGSKDAVNDIPTDYQIPMDYFNAIEQLEKYDKEIDELAEVLNIEEVLSSEPAVELIEERISDLVYFRDLDVQDSDYQKVKLFIDILNERLLFKTLGFDENRDLRINADDGSNVHFSDLSSGEQHLVILYYRLLFKIEPDTLVMIDEPELSMNVVWQRNFLKDLQRITELGNFDVLIATHSPQIIHDKWDWMVPLGEKVDD